MTLHFFMTFVPLARAHCAARRMRRACIAVHAPRAPCRRCVTANGSRASKRGAFPSTSRPKEGNRVLHSERYFGSVSRSFTLASEIDDAKAEALVENGVLTLKLPKRTAASARKISVN